jgi:hypothetical protein
VDKHNTLAKRNGLGPNYFWYVCPVDLVAASDVPEYAGLIYMRDDRRYPDKFPKIAPQLHRDHLQTGEYVSLGRSLSGRYWRLRMPKRERNA